MDYHVILIESGKPTHRWFYQDPYTALAQLEKLLIAFQEVNEVSATIVKAGISEREFSCSQLLQLQVISPDRSTLG